MPGKGMFLELVTGPRRLASELPNFLLDLFFVYPRITDSSDSLNIAQMKAGTAMEDHSHDSCCDLQGLHCHEQHPDLIQRW